MNSILRQLQHPDPDERRRAIVTLGRSGDPNALPALAHVYRDDPDPALRELALKAGRYLRQQTAHAAPVTSAPPAVPGPAVQAEPAPPQSPERPISHRDAQRAKQYASQAMDAFMNGDKARAATHLRKALSINPNLAADKATANLAGEITGQPPREALAALQGGDLPRLEKGAPRPRQPLSAGKVLTRVLLGFMLLVLAGLVVWFVQSGQFDRWRLALAIEGWKGSAQTIAGTQVYVVAPEGEPPAGGWPVLVAFHGYGGGGDSMLGVASIVVPQGVLFVAPTFGEYQPNPGNGPLGPMENILAGVQASYPVNARAVVLYGFSQGGTFAYRYSIYHPFDLAGVVTAGAPDFDAGLPTSRDLPYVITYGERDELYTFNEPFIFEMEANGFPVDYALVHNAEHEVTPYSVDRALGLIRAATDG
jgi:predicted esterase